MYKNKETTKKRVKKKTDVFRFVIANYLLLNGNSLSFECQSAAQAVNQPYSYASKP
jgi:hypothetical protein